MLFNPLILSGAGQDVSRLFCSTLLPFPDHVVGGVVFFSCAGARYLSTSNLRFVSFGVAFARLSPRGHKGIPLSYTTAFGRVLPSATIVAGGGLCRDIILSRVASQGFERVPFLLGNGQREAFLLAD